MRTDRMKVGEMYAATLTEENASLPEEPRSLGFPRFLRPVTLLEVDVDMGEWHPAGPWYWARETDGLKAHWKRTSGRGKTLLVKVSEDCESKGGELFIIKASMIAAPWEDFLEAERRWKKARAAYHAEHERKDALFKAALNRLETRAAVELPRDRVHGTSITLRLEDLLELFPDLNEGA